MSLTFPGVLHVFYGCLIIPVICTSPHIFKIDVSLFHAFIAATSRKIISESGLQGPDLMIWGRSTANDSRMCLHMALEHTTCAATPLHTRPIASLTAPINKSGAAQSKNADPSLIGVSTRLHEPLTPYALPFTRRHVQLVYVTAPIGRYSAADSRSALISSI
jgi:hypothetical protein